MLVNELEHVIEVASEPGASERGGSGAGRATTEPVDSAPSRPVVRDGSGRFAEGSGRPSRRTPGGQPGNLNAAVNPWVSFWRRRALRPADRWVLPLLELYAGSLVADRGGPEAMTAGEAHMIELAQLARGCTLLVLHAAAGGPGLVGRRRSASTKGGTVVQRLSEPDLAGTLVRFMSVERAALQAIGLERRAKPVQDDPMARLLAERKRALPFQSPVVAGGDHRVTEKPGAPTTPEPAA